MKNNVAKRYADLVEEARKLPPPTQEERQEQALSFAYGNLAMSTNHRPLRNAFLTLAQSEFGWSEEQFDRWSEGREWWP